MGVRVPFGNGRANTIAMVVHLSVVGYQSRNAGKSTQDTQISIGTDYEIMVSVIL